MKVNERVKWWLVSYLATPNYARRWLAKFMHRLKMPLEINAVEAELIQQIELAPHDRWWTTFARVVRKAFPGRTMLNQDVDGELKCQIHQFRYIISAQQALWVQQHYGQAGQTDAQALAKYLKTLSPRQYTCHESARLHNKIQQGQSAPVNFKVVINFQTEFILDQTGKFLNEVAVLTPQVSGIVNGASFNYARKNDLHRGLKSWHAALDVQPPKLYDPQYRRQSLVGYSALKLPQYREQVLARVQVGVQQFERLLKND